MNLLSLLFIAIGLSIDSFVVSVSSGICISELNKKHILKISGFLAIFQTIMPIIGWSLGIGFRKYIESYDHWIAFSLLGLLGLKMIYGGFYPHNSGKKFNPLNNIVLLTMSFATTIDALIVGISFAFLNISIIKSSLIIGITTFIFSATGILFGNQIKAKARTGVEIFGGLILISIGVEILIQHLYKI
jgi:manganese efflux pump family protein